MDVFWVCVEIGLSVLSVEVVRYAFGMRGDWIWYFFAICGDRICYVGRCWRAFCICRRR